LCPEIGTNLRERHDEAKMNKKRWQKRERIPAKGEVENRRKRNPPKAKGSCLRRNMRLGFSLSSLNAMIKRHESGRKKRLLIFGLNRALAPKYEKTSYKEYQDLKSTGKFMSEKARSAERIGRSSSDRCRAGKNKTKRGQIWISE
jgi:hypothetical protein